MKNKKRYVLVTGCSARHMNLSIERGDGNMRHYNSYEGKMPNGIRHFFSDAHIIVRARRMALCAVFFVELSLSANDKPAETFQVEINAVAV